MKIKNGIYLVIDPAMNWQELESKLKDIVKEKIAAIQIWDNFSANQNPVDFTKKVLALCSPENVPVLINNRWEMLKETDLSGIHFDDVPENFLAIKSGLAKDVIIGITCNNDLSVVEWANENGLDYVSFCSMFPSGTANSCELVEFEKVKKTYEITTLPIFLAGGINLENIDELNELNYSGIVAISGIMNANNSSAALKKYQKKLKLDK